MDIGGLDLRAGPLVTAFFGGMAYAVVLKIKNPFDLASVMVVGVGTSISIGPLITSELAGYFASVSPDALQNASGFISGLGGMAICNGLIALTRRVMAMLGARAGEAPPNGKE